MKEAIARFKRYLERRYPGRSTSKHYLSDLSIFRQFVGECSPREITAALIDQFVEAQAQQGLKTATLNRRLATLASFFDFLINEAQEEQWLNPVHWKRHGLKRGQHLPRDLSEQTVEQLFSVITDERDLAIFSLMLKAGLRVGEVVQLHLQDLHPPDAQGLSRLRLWGKGHKERVVWLTAEAHHSLQLWLAVRPASDSQKLFLNQHQQPLSISGVQYRLKAYCQQAGLQVSCHQLRHTFARRLVEQALPVQSLAKLLGHSSLQTTQLYIDGADPSLRQQFLQAIQNPLLQLTSAPQPTPLPTLAPSRAPEPIDFLAIVDKLAHLAQDLPEWLHQAIREHTLRHLPRWQLPRLKHQAHNLFGALCRIGRWLIQHGQWPTLEQLRRADLVAYLQAAQARGLKASSINTELKYFRGFWQELLAQERVSNSSILLVKGPKEGAPLPRFLTVAEFQRLEQYLLAKTQADQAADRFEQAWFYLLAHAGLRIGEVLNLRLSDCDLLGQRLRVRAGKGDRDRVLPLTPQLGRVLSRYLVVREAAESDHLLIFRGKALGRELLAGRLRQWGQHLQIVPLSPHRLRHTLATFLINQGMAITALQKFLGHQNLNTTQLYARVHDETVRQQFLRAMSRLEAIAVSDWPAPVEPLAVPASTQCN